MTVDRADQGLLLTLLELIRDRGAPSTSATVSEAIGILEEYVDIVEQRLEQNREQGFVDRDRSGRWRLTPSGIAAASETIRGHA